MDDQKLKKHYVAYIAGAVLFTATLSAAVFVERYCSEMRETVDKLRTLSGGSVKVRRATASVHESTEKIKREIPPGYLTMQAENAIFQAVDAVREKAKNSEVIVEALQDKGDEMSLPIAVKGTFRDYSEFLGVLHFLESLRFPFFSSSELLMTHEADKPVFYELRGTIRTLKNTEPTKAQPPPRRRS